MHEHASTGHVTLTRATQVETILELPPPPLLAHRASPTELVAVARSTDSDIWQMVGKDGVHKQKKDYPVSVFRISRR